MKTSMEESVKALRDKYEDLETMLRMHDDTISTLNRMVANLRVEVNALKSGPIDWDALLKKLDDEHYDRVMKCLSILDDDPARFRSSLEEEMRRWRAQMTHLMALRYT